MHYVAPIVEGHGEVEALPALLHRIAIQAGFEGGLRVDPPIRVKSGSFLNDDDYFSRYVSLAGAKAAQNQGSVLIVLDCEDQCPATLGPTLLKKAQAIRSDVTILVALAYREYETWFLAAAQSLRGLRGLPADLDPPVPVEGMRGAKEWLSRRMYEPYDPVTHQIEFTRAFDLDAARVVPSFERLFQRLSSLLGGSQAA